MKSALRRQGAISCLPPVRGSGLKPSNQRICNRKEGDRMKIEQYDRVLLTDGNKASIVEIFDDGQAFLADIDKDGDTYTEEITIEEIKKKL